VNVKYEEFEIDSSYDNNYDKYPTFADYSVQSSDNNSFSDEEYYCEENMPKKCKKKTYAHVDDNNVVAKGIIEITKKEKKYQKIINNINRNKNINNTLTLISNIKNKLPSDAINCILSFIIKIY
jgi:hypothetical protein